MKMISADAFEKCESLKVILVDDSCEASISSIKIPGSAKITFSQKVMLWGEPLSVLKREAEITFPRGTETIGNYWFLNSQVEIVTIPSDIRKIGTEAFFNCKKLGKVVFRKMLMKRLFASDGINSSGHQSSGE